VRAREPLPLFHSWPLIDRDRHLSLAPILGGFDYPFEGAASVDDGNELARHGIGLWECDLSDNSLTWTAGVNDIFGVPRDARPIRNDIVALYSHDSREIMERLRAYAIRHRRGFTIDLEIRPSLARTAWMRLTAAPICEGNKVVRLQGVKRLI
jgi:hypothetical protein